MVCCYTEKFAPDVPSLPQDQGEAGHYEPLKTEQPVLTIQQQADLIAHGLGVGSVLSS